MLSFAGVVGLRRETELPDTDFVFAFVPELVTNGQDMARAQLKVHPRNKIRPRLRIEYRLAEWNRGKSRIEQIEHDGIDDGGVLHVPAKPVKKEGSLRCRFGLRSAPPPGRPAPASPPANPPGRPKTPQDLFP